MTKMMNIVASLIRSKFSKHFPIMLLRLCEYAVAVVLSIVKLYYTSPWNPPSDSVGVSSASAIFCELRSSPLLTTVHMVSNSHLTIYKICSHSFHYYYRKMRVWTKPNNVFYYTLVHYIMKYGGYMCNVCVFFGCEAHISIIIIIINVTTFAHLIRACCCRFIGEIDWQIVFELSITLRTHTHF